MRKLRFDVFTFGILFISIGVLVAIGTIVASAIIFDKGYFVLGTGQIAIIAVGLLITAAGIAPILSYRRRKEVVYAKKENLDLILEKYQITYEFNLKFVRTYMDKWKVKYSLVLRQMWSTAENYEKETFVKKKLV
ncbi:MAG: hypothetical protein HWE14_10965 [Flavobacteriia bacterium]|nr:hypothetical protein [Flavobacteriia bacterium]